MLFLRPNEFHTAQRADYSVFDRTLDGERKVGRIYSGVGSLGDKWMWAISGWDAWLILARGLRTYEIRKAVRRAT